MSLDPRQLRGVVTASGSGHLRCVSPQVFRGGLQPLRRVAEATEPLVALVAQEAAKGPSGVVVVDIKALPAARRRATADRADVFLARERCMEDRGGNSDCSATFPKSMLSARVLSFEARIANLAAGTRLAAKAVRAEPRSNSHRGKLGPPRDAGLRAGFAQRAGSFRWLLGAVDAQPCFAPALPVNLLVVLFHGSIFS